MGKGTKGTHHSEMIAFFTRSFFWRVQFLTHSFRICVEHLGCVQPYTNTLAWSRWMDTVYAPNDAYSIVGKMDIQK